MVPPCVNTVDVELALCVAGACMRGRAPAAAIACGGPPAAATGIDIVEDVITEADDGDVADEGDVDMAET